MSHIIAFVFLGLVVIACNKEDKNHSCFDSSLVHENGCTTDCPGFEGCDGKHYCNACEAARHGIGSK